MSAPKYKPYPKENELKGDKGLKLYLRMELERLKGNYTSYEQVVPVILERHKDEYNGTKGDPENYDSLYSRYKDAKRDNKRVQEIEKNIKSGKCETESVIESLQELLNWL
ncbi:hypothetical protein AGMMS50222_03960 [Endomicrobiia bacterium]|nr:hypothetical protein AGMMS50222_03960 [Endomicrobiia bacterium]